MPEDRLHDQDVERHAGQADAEEQGGVRADHVGLCEDVGGLAADVGVVVAGVHGDGAVQRGQHPAHGDDAAGPAPADQHRVAQGELDAQTPAGTMAWPSRP